MNSCCVRVVEGSSRLRVRYASVKVGDVGRNPVGFGSVDGVSVVHCRVGWSFLSLEAILSAINGLTPRLSVLYFCRLTAELTRAILDGNDPNGVRPGGVCAGVGKRGRMPCLVATR